MKKKNRINPIEQHFEKVVLVGVSAVLLGVVSMQFLTQPNAVKVGNSPDPVPPGEVFDAIVPEAETLLARIRDPNPQLPDIPEQNVAQKFDEARSLSAADDMRLANFGATVSISGPELDTSAAELAATTYALPALPVPATVAAATHRAAVDPIVALTNDALKPYLPKQQPFDALAVSVEGSVSGARLMESLETDPDGAGPASPLPLMWWRGNIDLLGVEVQREELTTGGWTNATVISGMPGAYSAIAQARTADITPADLLKLAEDTRDLTGEIIHPKFPRTVAGPDWVRPTELVEEQGMSEQDRRIARNLRQLESADRAIATIDRQLQELGAGGAAGGTYNERSGGRGGEAGGGGQASDPTARRRTSLERQLDAQQQRRERILDDLAADNVFPDQEENQRDDEPEEIPVQPILQAQDMPVWVHDFTAEPGKTYRYRMRVVINNPLYGRGLYLSDAQKPAADAPTLEGDWSAWTEPVAVELDRQFFVTNASEDDALGSGPRASVEVYQFYYGYWRKGTATLSPGDSIYARTRLPDNLLIWDPEKLKELGRLPTPGGPRVGAPGGGDPRNPANERELLRRQFEEGQDMRDPRTRPGVRQNEEPQLPEGAQPGPQTLELDVPAMLLDVVRVPGEDRRFQAILKGRDGSILVRDSAADKSGPLYQRLAANAREGEEAGRPEPDPNAQQPSQREDRDMPEDPGRRVLPGG